MILDLLRMQLQLNDAADVCIVGAGTAGIVPALGPARRDKRVLLLETGGDAKRCLDKFLSRHAGEVTITTKYGIPPAYRARFAGAGSKIARPVVNYFSAIQKRLAGAANSLTCWSAEINLDLQDLGTLAQGMLKASLVMNPSSVIPFSSREPHRINANARVAQHPSLDGPARKLHDLIQTGRSALLNTTESGIQ